MAQKQTRTWRAGDTWRSVAYLYYNDSREFRSCIDLNGSFDIRTLPAQTVEVYVTYETERGKTPTSLSTPGTLQTSDIAINLNDQSTQVLQSDVASAIFPWNSLDSYVDRLAEYTAASLFERDRINGYSLDSAQAKGETQRG